MPLTPVEVLRPTRTEQGAVRNPPDVIFAELKSPAGTFTKSVALGTQGMVVNEISFRQAGITDQAAVLNFFKNLPPRDFRSRFLGGPAGVACDEWLKEQAIPTDRHAIIIAEAHVDGGERMIAGVINLLGSEKADPALGTFGIVVSPLFRSGPIKELLQGRSIAMLLIGRGIDQLSEMGFSKVHITHACDNVEMAKCLRKLFWQRRMNKDRTVRCSSGVSTITWTMDSPELIPSANILTP